MTAPTQGELDDAEALAEAERRSGRRLMQVPDRPTVTPQTESAFKAMLKRSERPQPAPRRRGLYRRVP